MIAVPVVVIAAAVTIGLHRDVQRRAQWVHDECTVLAMREAIAVYYRTHGTYPPHPGDLARCPTLTPAEEHALVQVRQMVVETARVYQVSPPTVAVVEISGMVASYRPGLVLLHAAALSAVDRDAVLAHELAHAVLGHAARWGVGPPPTDVEDRRLELDANAKSVEILARVKGWPEWVALRVVHERLLRQHRAVTLRGARPAPGHRSPCEEIEDLLRRFAHYRGWTAQFECAPRMDLG